MLRHDRPGSTGRGLLIGTAQNQAVNLQKQFHFPAGQAQGGRNIFGTLAASGHSKNLGAFVEIQAGFRGRRRDRDASSFLGVAHPFVQLLELELQFAHRRTVSFVPPKQPRFQTVDFFLEGQDEKEAKDTTRRQKRVGSERYEISFQHKRLAFRRPR